MFKLLFHPTLQPHPSSATEGNVAKNQLLAAPIETHQSNYTAGELKQNSKERSCVIKNQIIHVLLELLLHLACHESYLLIEIHDKVYD